MNTRKTLQALANGERPTGDPPFLPLVFGACAQIEALPPGQMAADATRLGKGLGQTRRVLGTDALFVSVPAAAEAQALGAEVNLGTWPPSLVSHPGGDALHANVETAIAGNPRLQASLELTRRLAATAADEVALIAGLTGPATLVSQLMPEAAGDDCEDAFDQAGSCLTALVRAFGEAGAQALVVLESVAVAADADGMELWQEALAPLANVARFHKIPLLLGFAGAAPPATGDWPAQVIPCVAPGAAAEFGDRPYGLLLPADADAWSPPEGRAAIVLTAGEVPADTPIATLKQRIEAMR